MKLLSADVYKRQILDTHVGSASSLIALEEAEIPYVGFEIDSFMYQISKQRLEEFRGGINHEQRL